MKKRMKKSVKGFTLVEIIVAMAILALASLVLALMYASIANSMNMTNDIHDRMSEQQKYVELYEADKQAAGGAGGSGGTGGTGGSGSGAADPIADSKDGKKLNIYCTHNAANKSWVGASAANSKNFVVNCTVYELYNFEDGRPVPKSQDDDDLTVNLKYFVGDNSLE